MEPSDDQPDHQPDHTADHESVQPSLPTLPTLPPPSRHPRPPTSGLPQLPPPPSEWSPERFGVPSPSGQQGQWGQPGTPGAGLRPAHMYRPVVTPWWKRAIAPLLVVAVIGGIVALAVNAKHATTSRHPDEWDPRVAKIAAFVSETRELEWSHPVYIDFLPEDEFVALFDQPARSATPAEVAAQRSALYNAKGLAVSYDPDASENTVQAVTTLAFYSPGNDRIAMRGDELTPAVRVVLAHELTHALQAQHFDLNKPRPNDLEFRAVVEADALRVENVYRDTLSAAEQEQADAGNTLTEEASTALDDVPWALIDQSYAPYVLGPNLVNAVFAERGNAGVDDLLTTPPTEEILLDPWLLGTEQTEPNLVLVAPADSTTIEGTQPLSPVEMLIILDAWLPFGQARAALAGWGSGLYTSYETADGVVCFAAKVGFDSDAAAANFSDTVTDWTTASGVQPDSQLNDDTVKFEACDRGPQAAPTPTPIISPMFALSLEHDAISIAGTNPTPEQIAGYQCFAATVIDDPIAAPLLASQAEFTDEQQATFDAQTDKAAEACGVPPLER